ncbi:MAG: gamma-glutamyl-gamma-aminobutyrate hydrolase family protein [Chloroflexota bacterium]
MPAEPRILVAFSGEPTTDEWDSYADAIEQAGGQPIGVSPRLPHTDLDVRSFDGVLLTGGVDVDPARYGAERDRRTEAPFLERDALEVAIATAALEFDVPLLAICRGMQLLNVVCGGSLHQHLTDVEPHRPRRIDGSPEWQSGWHQVEVTAGSLLARLSGESSLQVNSRHHQAVTPERLAPTVTATGRTEHSGFTVIEAIEVPGHRFALGVQWHPERPEMRADSALYNGSRALLDGFIEACRFGSTATAS